MWTPHDRLSHYQNREGGRAPWRRRWQPKSDIATENAGGRRRFYIGASSGSARMTSLAVGTAAADLPVEIGSAAVST